MAGKVEQITIDLRANASEFLKTVENMKSSIGKMDLGHNLTANLQSELANAAKQIQTLMNNIGDGMMSEKQAAQVQRRMQTIINNVNNAVKKVDVSGGLTHEDPKIKQILNNIQRLTKEKDKLKSTGIFDQAKLDKEQQKLAKEEKELAKLQELKEKVNKGTVTDKDKANNAQFFRKDGTLRQGEKSLDTAIEKKQASVDKSKNIVQGQQNAKSLNAAQQAANEQKLLQVDQQLSQEEQKLAEAENEAAQARENFGQKAKDVTTAEQNLTNSLNQNTQAAAKNDARMKNMQGLVSYFSYMFSATAIFMKFRQAITEAFNNFKELDKQFNEISIVTGRTMNQMWATFKSVNSVAQEYGVTSSNVVSVQKLYYQQGRSANEVTKLTGETLKFAKISGLDFADATDKMTAALNAYGLKASEANQITDAYAALSSHAAATTEEIAVAMSKVASISALSGNTLNETSAYLTKIIETTRESAETAGTALKTVIARFTEIDNLTQDDKELLDPEYNFNNIEKALKTVGVATKDSAGNMREFSAIMNDLGPIWDSLSSNQQHYIATQAAGSRQQSRFIALMSNWSRTADLVETANNSAGTSDLQLQRAMESLETATNKLKSSWEQFYTQFLNSNFFKGLIDGANSFLNILKSMPTVLQPVIIAGGFMLAKNLAHSIGEGFKTHIYPALTKPFKGVLTKLSKENLMAGAIRRKGGISQVITKRDPKATNLPGFGEITKSTKAVAGMNVQLGKQTDLISSINKTKALGNSLDQTQIGNLGKQITLAAQQNGVQLINNTEKGEELGIDTVQSVLDGAGIELSEEETKQLRDQILAQGELNKLKEEDILATGTQVVEEESRIVATEAGQKTDKKGISLLFEKISAKWAEVKANLAVLMTDPLTRAFAIAAVAAIGIMVGAIIVITKRKNEQAAANKAVTDSENKYIESLKKYKELRQKLDRYKELKAITLPTADEQQEFIDLANELGEAYPAMIAYHDENGDAVLKETDKLEELAKAQKKNLDQARKAKQYASANYMSYGFYTGDTEAGRQMSNLGAVTKSYGEAEEGSAEWGKLESIALEAGEARSEIQAGIKQIQEGKFDLEVMNRLSGHEGGNFDDLLEKIGKIEETDPDKYNEELSQALKEWGLSDKQLNMFMQLNDEFGNTLVETIKQLPDALKQLRIENARLEIQELETEYGVDIGKGMRDALAEEAGNVYEKAFDREFDSAHGGKLTTEQKNAVTKAIDEGKSYEESGVQKYVEKDEYEDIAKQIKDSQEKYENFVKDIGEANSVTQNAQRHLDEKLKGMSLTQLGRTADLTDPDAFFSSLGFDPNLLTDEFKETYKSVYDGLIQKQKEAAEKSKKEITDIIGTGYDGTLLNKMTADQLKSFSNTLANVNSELGEAGARAFTEAYKDTFNELTPELQAEFSSVDFMDEQSIVDFRTKLVKTYGEGSSAVQKFDNTVAHSGSMLKKNLLTFDKIVEKIKADISKLSSSFDELANAVDGSMSFDALMDLMQALDGDLNLSDITVTANGFKMSAANAEKYRKALLDAKKAEYSSMLMTQSNTKAKLQNRIATQKQIIADLEHAKQNAKDSDEQLKYDERIQAARTNLDEYTGSLEAAENEVKNINNAMRSLSLAYQYLDLSSKAKQLEKVKEKLQEIVDALKSIDKYANIERYLTTLENKIADYEFNIEFSTNVEEITRNTINEIKDLNKIVSASTAEAEYAQQIANKERNALAKTYSKYLSFDKDNNVILSKNIQQLAQSNKEYYDLMMERVEEYTTDLQKVSEASQKAQENLKKVQEIINKQYENITSLESKLFELMQTRDQEIIDNMTKRYDSMKKLDEDYLKSVQDAVSKERELRDQNKSIEELEQQEKKLQLLKMSGGSATQIQQLEKEIADKRQNIADKQIDNLLKELEEENTKRAEAMDEQVQYEQDTFDERVKNRIQYNQEINTLMQQNSQDILTWMKQYDEEFKAGTEAARDKWITENTTLVTNAAAAMQTLADKDIASVENAYKKVQQSTKDASAQVEAYADSVASSMGEASTSVGKLNDKYNNQIGIVETLTKKYGALEKAVTEYKKALGQQIKRNTPSKEKEDNLTGEKPTVYQDKILNPEHSKEPTKGTKFSVSNAGAKTLGLDRNGEYYIKTLGYNTFGISKNENGDVIKTVSRDLLKGVLGIQTWEYAPNADGYNWFYGDDLFHADKDSPILDPTRKVNGILSTRRFSKVQISNIGASYNDKQYYKVSTILDNKGDPEYYWLRKEYVDQVYYESKYSPPDVRFAKGGLVDFTGPAWVDGTPSKPEAFLSAADTEMISNFTSALKTIVFTPSTAQAQNSGDTYYEFHINVDELGDGYSVDDLIEEMEDRILEATGNSNVIKLR